MTCDCGCHGGPGAFRPACTVPGGCGPHDERRCERGRRCAAREYDHQAETWRGAPADRALCPVCEQRVTDTLAAVPSLWTALSTAVRIKGGGQHGERVSGHSPASQRSPLNLGAQTLLDDVHGLLTRWEEVVRDKAGLIPPGEHTGRDAVVAAADMLGEWLSVWLACGPTEFALDRTTDLTETGPQAAARLLDWAHTARNLPGVDAQAPKALRRYHQPCPACGVQAVTHRAGDDLMHCQNCGATQPYLPTLPRGADYADDERPTVPEPLQQPHRGPGAAVGGHDAHAGRAAHTYTEGAA